MKRLLPLIAFVALAGCSGQPDAPPPTEPAAGQPPVPSADSVPAPSPSPTPSSKDVPERFQGTYAVDDKACAQPGHESRLVLSVNDVQFHESGGPIELAHVEGDTLHVTARVTGEGETRQAAYGFALSADGRQLRDVEHGMVRVRCP